MRELSKLDVGCAFFALEFDGGWTDDLLFP